MYQATLLPLALAFIRASAMITPLDAPQITQAPSLRPRGELSKRDYLVIGTRPWDYHPPLNDREKECKNNMVQSLIAAVPVIPDDDVASWLDDLPRDVHTLTNIQDFDDDICGLDLTAREPPFPIADAYSSWATAFSLWKINAHSSIMDVADSCGRAGAMITLNFATDRQECMGAGSQLLSHYEAWTSYVDSPISEASSSPTSSSASVRSTESAVSSTPAPISTSTPASSSTSASAGEGPLETGLAVVAAAIAGFVGVLAAL